LIKEIVMTMLKEIFQLDEKMWSGDIEAKWTPPTGFFKKGAAEIARGLKSASKDYAQASRRLNFYINRGGQNLSAEDKARLESAKTALRKAYGIKESRIYEGMGFHPNMNYNPINSATVSAIETVAKKHLANVDDKEAVNTLLGLAFAKGYYAGHSEFESQSKKHLVGISSKESVKSAMDDAYAKGFSAGKSSWQK
jgi:hypothetical protein